MSTAIIQCHNLSHFYSGKAALSNVNFEVFAGEPIGLVGPNGAGKTTLLSILCGFLLPSSGSVTLFGQKPGASALSGKVAALPQDARLDPGFTIGQQLTFYGRLQGLGLKQAKYETERVLEAVSLKSSINEKPVTLSHGMGKRVAIAQALIGNPALILLDEPTAGLDPVNMRNIRSIITEMTAQTTFIISSHDLAELGRLSQHVLLLENGVMNTLHLNDTEQNTSNRFLTLQMENSPAENLMQEIKKISAVINVKNPQKNEYIVEYDAEIEARVDIKIIQCLADNNWQYRQLSQGKTLEEKLFFQN